mmetsp:Transcript_16176/g.37156  ORF Transcript_16176/g.37156 Transcript_16176/m.37156 type:complete len:612 (-) Transcript_16176:122-1957(-)
MSDTAFNPPNRVEVPQGDSSQSLQALDLRTEGSASSKQSRRPTVQFSEGNDGKRSQIPGEMWLKAGQGSDGLARRYTIPPHAGMRSRGERLLHLARIQLLEVIEQNGSNLSEEVHEKLKGVEEMMRSIEVHDSEDSFSARPFSPVGSPTVAEGRRSSKVAFRRLSASCLLSRSPNLDTEVARYIKGTCTTDQARRPSSMSLDLDRRRPSATSDGSNVSDSIKELDTQTVQLLEKVGAFDCDCGAIATQLDSGILALLFGSIMTRTGLLQDLSPLILNGNEETTGAFEERMRTFFLAAEQAYMQNPYHNSTHAADVLMMMHWFLNSRYLRSNLNPLDQLMCYIAAAIHDMGHDGVNNMFHQKTRSILSLRYNDRSPLENMHVALAFETMKAQQECNWFELITRAYVNEGAAKEGAKAVDLQHYVRAGIISMVLATDNTKHDHLIADLGDVLAEHDKTPLDQSVSPAMRSPLSLGQKDAAHQKIPEVVLHAADISNPARPVPIMLYWTRRVLMEFWAQGDEEKRLGLEISPLCDRSTGISSVPQGQIGFATFVVRPLFMQLARLIPEVEVALDQLEKNGEYWKRRKEENASFEDVFGAIEETDSVATLEIQKS